MQSVQQKYKRNMAKLMAHTPDTEQLAVVGSSMTEALGQQAIAPITLAHVLQWLQEADPASYEQYVALKAEHDKTAQADAERRLAVCINIQLCNLQHRAVVRLRVHAQKLH